MSTANLSGRETLAPLHCGDGHPHACGRNSHVVQFYSDDCLAQSLVGLNLNAEILRPAPGHEELWLESQQLVQQCISEFEKLSYVLHPSTMEWTLFCALQEALTNVEWQGGGSAAAVRIVGAADRIELRVKDNGRGIQQECLKCVPKNGNGLGVGLLSWRERVRNLGSDLCIESDGSGAAITISIPESRLTGPESSALEVLAKQAERPQ